MEIAILKEMVTPQGPHLRRVIIDASGPTDFQAPMRRRSRAER
ncbi:hypothetical protein ACTMTI_44145 [Nonomuraea sp. H19]